MKLYKVIDKDGGKFMGGQLWTAGQIRTHLYQIAKSEFFYGDIPKWNDFTLNYCLDTWSIELEEQKDLR